MRFRIAAVGLLLVGCYASGEGIAPPLEQIYFPVGLAVDKDQKRLYVASSDFDLQYNAGSLQALDLARVRALIPRECQADSDCQSTERCDQPGEAAEGDAARRSYSYLCVARRGDSANKPCGVLGEQSTAERVTVPGRCGHVELTASYRDPTNPDDAGGPILADSVGIGAFATDVQLRYSPPDRDGNRHGRLFVPVRGEASLHWIDLAGDGNLDCGQTDGSPSCDGAHRRGTDEDENSRGVRMPNEPYGIALSDEGDALVVTHQTEGEVSLFHQDLGNRNGWESPPNLEFIQTDLPMRALSVASVPAPLLARFSRAPWLGLASQTDAEVLFSSDARVPIDDPFPPGFLVTYRDAAQVDLLRYYADGASSPTRPYLQLAATVAVAANSVGTDSRGVAFDDSERQACEDRCLGAVTTDAEEFRGCLADCAAMPIGVYVASRAPASLLVGATIPDTWGTPNRDVPRFYDTVPLPTGPSRVYVGKVVGDDGLLETRVFAICFDQRRIAVYDPRRRVLEGFVTTGRGPHAMAFDFAPADEAKGTPARALAYVAHFTDSYVGVIELDRRKIRTYSNIVLNLGSASAPRAQK